MDHELVLVIADNAHCKCDVERLVRRDMVIVARWSMTVDFGEIEVAVVVYSREWW